MKCNVKSLIFTKKHLQIKKKNLNLSVPFMPRIPEEFLENKTVIIGQETNTWYRNSYNDGLASVFLNNLISGNNIKQ
jgi:hypothetical protein